MKYITKETIESFVKDNYCLDPWAEELTYCIYVDADGKLYDNDDDGEGRVKLFDTVELDDEHQAMMAGDPYALEHDERFEDYFDLVIENLASAYVDLFGQIVDDEDDSEKYELGYYNEDTSEFRFDRGSYATFDKAMKSADEAGDWFDTVIGDHRAIDVVMSMGVHFDVDPEKYEYLDELVLEIERRHDQKAADHDWEETEVVVNKIKAAK